MFKSTYNITNKRVVHRNLQFRIQLSKRIFHSDTMIMTELI